MTPRRLVLIGGGHAHLHVLRDLARRPIVDVETILVAADDHWYGAMVAGYLQGQYEVGDLRIDLAALAARAGARLVRAVAHRIDVEQRIVVTPNEQLAFDVCSLDVACVPAGADAPGVAEHAVALQALKGAMELRARVDAMIASARPVAAVVVGAGRQGVEVALALHERLRSAPAGGHVSLVEAGTDVLSDFEPPLRRLAIDALRARGVSIALGGRVTSVTASDVTLHNGASLPADLVVWATGAAAPPLVARSGLARDEAGYFAVDRSLRAIDGAPVWGAGCCVSIKGVSRAQRGDEYAVREPPTLDRSLRAALGRGRPGRYRPQGSSLTLLNAGGGWALMRWKGIHRYSRWAWRLKDMIDRRFVRRYRESDEKSRTAS